MGSCNSGAYAPTSMCGVPATSNGSNALALSLGYGLKQAGTEVVVDYCEMLKCVQDRAPVGEAYMLMCDSAGLFKMSMTRLKSLVDADPVTPVAPAVYTLAAGDSSVVLKKDGVAVSAVPLCDLVSGCGTGGGRGSTDAYTLTQSGNDIKLKKNGTTVSTVTVTSGGVQPTYTLGVSGTNVILKKDGADVSFASICPAVTSCGGGGGGGGNTNNPPTASNATYSTLKNTAKVTPNLVTLASDPDGNTLTVTSVSNSAHGTVANAGGVVTYTPSTDYIGTDTFTYTVSDGTLTATGTITMNVAESGGGGGGGGNLI